MSLHRKLSVSSGLLGTLLFTRFLPAQNPAADLVLIHCHRPPWRHRESGTDTEVLKFAGTAPGTRIIDLIPPPPGLIDTRRVEPACFDCLILC